ncbi:bifunctional DNA primase/polymerase [Nocardia jiangxiensis]|uniref:Bifunctional DNA primase/polymerase n=1 Tax=Nocardia jiangxiensis TaxID=282685 RepID=A0ABW6RYW3_9NOCA
MSTNDFREAALGAAARGWFVFPLRPGRKTPAIASWPEFATTDPARIRRWWATHPRRNIGVATGPSGLYVIDIDTHTDPDPLVRLADRIGVQVPATFTVHTPHGRHLYFQAPTTLELRRCTVGRIASGIDSRGDGGYIVAPGSVVAAERYRVADPHQPAALPDWLTDWLAPPPPPLVPTPAPSSPNAYVAAIISSEAARVTHAANHFRNATLFHAAFTLGRLIAAGHLTEDHARTALTAAASPHIGQHEFTRAELDRTLSNGLTYGKRYPRHLNTHPIANLGGPK